MKRLVRSTSGRQIYGPKWQNTEATNDIESHEESSEVAHVSDTDEDGNTIQCGVAAAPSTVNETDVELQLPIKRNRIGIRSDSHRSMYQAALVGDWLAAEKLLERDSSLARDEITARGDRALHVAAAMKHKEFVQSLVERMSPSDLELLDGPHGYTACCYAAVTGIVEIADVMMKKIPNLGTARDKKGETPLYKAVLHGKAKMVSYFLKPTKVEDLSKLEEWFDLLLAAIRNKMYDVASEILEKEGSLATMANEKGTALHLLARQQRPLDSRRWMISKFLMEYNIWWRMFGWVWPPIGDDERLAEKLMAEIERLEEASALELMKNPPILHDAAKVGNAELIAMITRAYPDLIWNTDSNGHTIFHVAVMYRQDDVFRLIHHIGAMKDLVATLQDKNGNNILHLAAGKNLAPPDRMRIVAESSLQFRREIAWFYEVKAISPPVCCEMRNKDDKRPMELFWMQKKELLAKNETWMRNTADSCMLIATLVLTVVFAAAFAVPGGYNSSSGIPLIFKSNWFTCFVIFEAFALFCSTLSIVMFWSIMTSSFEDEHEVAVILPRRLLRGLDGLFCALVGAISAFMSAYFLVFVEERPWLVKSVIIVIYILLVYAIYSLVYYSRLTARLPSHLSWMLSRPSRHTLFNQTDKNQKSKLKPRWWSTTN